MNTPVGTRHQPLRIAVCDEIRLRIVDGTLPKGERILEDQLAQELGVSRNPVREALQTLAHEGFVELEPRRGARVTMLSNERARCIFEVREGIEGMVAELAAIRRTPEQLAELRQIVAEGCDRLALDQLTTLPALNRRFHLVLGDATGNPILADMLAGLSSFVQWLYGRRLHERGTWSWHEHGTIVDAIADGDAERAAATAREHIRNARDAYFRSE